MDTLLNSSEELYEIKHDVADPSGSGLVGTSVGIDLTKQAFCHPKVRFESIIATLDLFKSDDELMILMWCPRCRNQNRISSKRKRIELVGERISIEKFSCTWPGCGLTIEVKDGIARRA